MIAIRDVTKIRKNRKWVDMPHGDPVKFLDLQSEAAKYVADWNKDSVSSRVMAEEWSIGQFAEWVREQFENINNRLDNHNL